jgi:hypothetical protein
MIYWTGVAIMIAGTILLVFCASMLACHQQRRLAAKTIAAPSLVA